MSESSLPDRRFEGAGMVVGVFAKQTHAFSKDPEGGMSLSNFGFTGPGRKDGLLKAHN
jgi:hypothetical protein